MAEKLIWVLEDSTYRVSRGAAEVLFFSRNYEDKFKTITHVFTGFRPYCLVPADEFPPLPPGCDYGDEIEFDALNREVRKVYTDVPATVRKIRDLFTFTDMADFLFEKRFAVDHGIYYAYRLNEAGLPENVEIDDFIPPRVLGIDIETLAPQGTLPLPHDAKWPVVSIQSEDFYTGEIIVFTASNLNINGERVMFPQTDAPDHVACKNEQELFKVFQAYMSEINPDVLTAWSGARYDLPFLIRRAKVLGISCTGLARHGIPRCEIDNEADSGFSTSVKGRCTLDMLEAYKKFYKQKAQRESYDLKSVSADYGFEYVDYGAKLLELLHNKEYEKFLQYCRNDVIALKNIDDKVGLFNFYEALRKIAGCKLNDTLHNSVVIEAAFLKNGMKAMPTKAPYTKGGDKFEGALVLLPPAGIHEWVGTVDLAALYPTVMRAFPDKCCPDPNYKVIEILELFVSERERYRALNKTDASTPLTELIEYIFKVLANSVYGALGLKSFRLFKRECAENVTSIGRDVDRFVHKCLLKHGYKTVYSDSVAGDSVIKLYDKKGNWKFVNIEDMFTTVDVTEQETGKEYHLLENVYVESIDENGKVILDRIKCVMRHKCNKQMYRVTDQNSIYIDVTEDHSLITYDGFRFCEIRPIDLKNTHYPLISYLINPLNEHTSIVFDNIASVEKINYSGYVYDLTTEQSHKFFANGLLLKNTDSSFFYPVNTPEEGLKVQDKLNVDLEEWGLAVGARVKFTLKFEKLYRRILFKKDEKAKKEFRWGDDVGAKKKYVGHLLWKEGVDYSDKRELNFMGLELVRSDSSQFTKKMLREFFEIILIDGDTVAGSAFIRKSYKDVKAGKINVKELSIPKQIRAASRAASPHKRGIQNTHKVFNYNIPDGVKPRLIYVKDYPYEFCIDDELDIGDWNNKIDWETTLEKNVTKKLRLYAESAGINWNHVIYGQQSIRSFLTQTETVNEALKEIEKDDAEDDELEPYEMS